MKFRFAINFFFMAIALLLMSWGFIHFKWEDDPVRSLDVENSFESQVFRNFHEKSFFKNKLFVDIGLSSEEQVAEIQQLVTQAGYQALPSEPVSLDKLSRLLPLLEQNEIHHLLSAQSLRERADKLASFAQLPGGSAVLNLAQSDPLGLFEALQLKLQKLLPQKNQERIAVFQSPPQLSYHKLGILIEQFRSKKISFIGGDLYSYENYKVIQRDVALCAGLSVILNVILFLYFTRKISLIVILVLGSVVSYAVGFFLVGAWFGTIYSLALAFTSTLVGFNNESLVHLSGGIGEPSHRKKLVGVVSALGTTILGFLLLLSASNVLIRQMALAALGGMAGFLLVLFLCQQHIKAVTYKVIPMPRFAVPRGVLVFLAIVGCVVTFLYTKIETSIHAFRFETPELAADAAKFQNKLDRSQYGRFVGFEIPSAPAPSVSEYWFAVKKLNADLMPHPLDVWKPISEQNLSINAFKKQLPIAIEFFQQELQKRGLAMKISTTQAATIGTALAEPEFLSLANELSPLKWWDVVEGKRILFASKTNPLGNNRHEPNFETKLNVNDSSFDLDPQRYFNKLLTGVSRELSYVYLIGLVAMIVYLYFVQRNLMKVLYIVTPVFLTSGVFALIAHWRQEPLNFVHFIGFSLTIALAIDYTSVAVSADHDDEDRAKILLTGLSSLATFGILILAKHPVLKTLGYTVTLGCGIGLAFALFLTLKPGESNSKFNSKSNANNRT